MNECVSQMSSCSTVIENGCSKITSEDNIDEEPENHSAAHVESVYNRNEELSPNPTNESTMRRPTFWQETYISHLVLCLFPASFILLAGISYLPKTHHNETLDRVTSIVCTFAVVVLSLLALITFVYLVRKTEKLHAQEIVMWPGRCRHCAHLIRLHVKALSMSGKTVSTSEILDSSVGVEYLSPINKSTLYITCIFAALVIFLFVLRTCLHAVCLFSVSLNSYKSTYERYEVIVYIIIDIYTVCTVYVINFRFIPTFFDAHFVAVPKLRWSMVFIVGFCLWQAISRLMEPFGMVSNDGKPINFNCRANSTLDDIVDGAFEIFEPFYVELVVMISWFMGELWSRFYPPFVERSSNCNYGNQETFGIQEKELRRNRLYLPHLCGILKHCKKRSYMNLPEQHPLLPVNNISNPPAECDSSKLMRGPIDTVRNSSATQINDRQKRWLSTRLELSIGLVLVAGSLYFGISNFILVEISEEDGKGRYVQWIFRMIFLTPGIVLIFQQRRMARKYKSNYNGRQDIHAVDLNSVGSHNIFIFLLTGASLYLIACLVAALGNICNAAFLTKEMIHLNVVSSITSVFELFRKNLEGMFLLCVHSQHPINDIEREWTLICLSYICVANATQWLWDSFVHEVTSPVAWPVFETFFKDQVGKVIGILLVPLVHVYELHVTILAYQILKTILSS